MSVVSLKTSNLPTVLEVSIVLGFYTCLEEQSPFWMELDHS